MLPLKRRVWGSLLRGLLLLCVCDCWLPGWEGTAPHVVPVEQGLPGHSVATPRVARTLGCPARGLVAGPLLLGSCGCCWSSRWIGCCRSS